MSTRHVALIRAVMIGREGLHRDVVLSIFEEAGAAEPVSHLATGNVSFDIEPDRLPELEESVDAALTAVVGRDIEVFVRSIAELRAIDGPAIFASAPIADPVERVVTFFHEPPDLSAWTIPQWLRKDRVVVFRVDGREVFSVNQLVDGTTVAPGGMLEKASGQRATTRGWSTIERLVRLHPED